MTTKPLKKEASSPFILPEQTAYLSMKKKLIGTLNYDLESSIFLIQYVYSLLFFVSGEWSYDVYSDSVTIVYFKKFSSAISIIRVSNLPNL